MSVGAAFGMILGMHLTRLLPVLALASTAVAALPADEVAPATTLPCFPGAIYRKAVSSVDRWTGIDATIVLPTFTPDPARIGANGRPLDNASCYVGGRAGETEIDAGVSWEVIREPDGTVSKERKAFRPFWRNAKWFSGPARPDLYFYPGDTIRMVCRSDVANRLIFRVELLARAGQPPGNAPISFHEVTLDAVGFGPGRAQEFKRVTAIDQVGNEGRAISSTGATVTGARWTAVSLSRSDQDVRPMVPARFTDMRCPDPELVAVTPGEESEEKIDLRGRAATPPGKAR